MTIIIIKMGKAFYQLGIIFLYLYFKIAIFFGYQKAIKSEKGRGKWKKKLIKNLNPNKPNYLLHASSFGEGLMAIPLIEKIIKEKSANIILTFFSSSGYENFNYEDSSLVKVYLPLDFKNRIKEFIEIVNPKQMIFVKYDLWMNLIDVCLQKKIPISVFSSKFFENHWYFSFYGKWARKRLQKFSNIFTIDNSSKVLLESKGFDNVMLSGDTRFDNVYTENKKSSLKVNRPCIVIGSSWEKEEELAVNLLKDFEDISIIIAPHEIDKNRIKNIRKKFGKSCVFYSELKNKDLPKLLIIDKIGLLADLYSLSDLAIVGGGFSGKLHNILEPAAKGNIIFFGQHHSKYPEANLMIESGFAFEIKSYNFLKEKIKQLLIENSFSKYKTKSKDFVSKNKGATKIIYENIFK